MHIGKRIREKLREDGRSVTWFAMKICCTRTNAYKLFNKSNIDTDMLERISRILEHDFFEEISRDISLHK